MVPLADIGWAGLILAEGWASIPIIIASLVIEWPVFKLVFDVPLRRALYATLIANTASFLFGLILIPIGTLGFELVSELIFKQPTFTIGNEMGTSLVAAFICAAIEYPTARWFLKAGYRFRDFLAIYAVNIVTVGIAAEIAFRASPGK